MKRLNFFISYSYGEPVKGTAHVRIALNHHLYDVDTDLFPHYQEKLQLDNGAAIFECRVDNFVSYDKQSYISIVRIYNIDKNWFI